MNELRTGTAIRGSGTFELEVALSGDLLRRIQDLAGDGSAEAIGEVLRKAVAIYEASARAHREGKAVGIAATPDALETEFVGF